MPNNMKARRSSCAQDGRSRLSTTSAAATVVTLGTAIISQAQPESKKSMWATTSSWGLRTMLMMMFSSCLIYYDSRMLVRDLLASNSNQQVSWMEPTSQTTFGSARALDSSLSTATPISVLSMSAPGLDSLSWMMGSLLEQNNQSDEGDDDYELVEMAGVEGDDGDDAWDPTINAEGKPNKIDAAKASVMSAASGIAGHSIPVSSSISNAQGLPRNFPRPRGVHIPVARKPFVPKATSCTNMTTTQIVQYRPRHSRGRPLHEFLQGPGLIQPYSHRDRVVCEFQERRFSRHFPHAMEQFYRCWSWFMTHPEATQRVMIHPNWHKGFPLRDGSMDFVGWRAFEGTLFLPGMGIFMNQYFNVSYTEHREHYVHEIVNMKEMPKNETYAFAKPEHAQALSNALADHYQLPPSLAGCPASLPSATIAKRMPRIAILNRDAEKALRSVLNVDELAAQVSAAVFGSSSNESSKEIPIAYFEGSEFPQQVDFFRNVDILISPHGAQLTGVGFMPACGALVELFPVGYYEPFYFGSLAEAAGLEYQALYVSNGNLMEETEYWMRHMKLRKIARSANLCADTSVVVQQVQLMIERWQQCCDAQQAS